MSDWQHNPYPQNNPNNPWNTHSHQDSNERPAAVLWFKIYSAVMTLMYLGTIAMGGMLVMLSSEVSGAEQTELLIYGVVFVITGAVFGIASFVSLFLPRTKWAYVMQLMLVALGMTSCCFLPFCIPILLGYMKPEVKRYFNAEDGSHYNASTFS